MSTAVLLCEFQSDRFLSEIEKFIVSDKNICKNNATGLTSYRVISINKREIVLKLLQQFNPNSLITQPAIFQALNSISHTSIVRAFHECVSEKFNAPLPKPSAPEKGKGTPPPSFESLLSNIFSSSTRIEEFSCDRIVLVTDMMSSVGDLSLFRFGDLYESGSEFVNVVSHVQITIPNNVDLKSLGIDPSVKGSKGGNSGGLLGSKSSSSKKGGKGSTSSPPLPSSFQAPNDPIERILWEYDSMNGAIRTSLSAPNTVSSTPVSGKQAGNSSELSATESITQLSGSSLLEVMLSSYPLGEKVVSLSDYVASIESKLMSEHSTAFVMRMSTLSGLIESPEGEKIVTPSLDSVVPYSNIRNCVSIPLVYPTKDVASSLNINGNSQIPPLVVMLFQVIASQRSSVSEYQSWLRVNTLSLPDPKDTCFSLAEMLHTTSDATQPSDAAKLASNYITALNGVPDVAVGVETVLWSLVDSVSAVRGSIDLNDSDRVHVAPLCGLESTFGLSQRDSAGDSGSSASSRGIRFEKLMSSHLQSERSALLWLENTISQPKSYCTTLTPSNPFASPLLAQPTPSKEGTSLGELSSREVMRRACELNQCHHLSINSPPTLSTAKLLAAHGVPRSPVDSRESLRNGGSLQLFSCAMGHPVPLIFADRLVWTLLADAVRSSLNGMKQRARPLEAASETSGTSPSPLTFVEREKEVDFSGSDESAQEPLWEQFLRAQRVSKDARVTNRRLLSESFTRFCASHADALLFRDPVGATEALLAAGMQFFKCPHVDAPLFAARVRNSEALVVAAPGAYSPFVPHAASHIYPSSSSRISGASSEAKERGSGSKANCLSTQEPPPLVVWLSKLAEAGGSKDRRSGTKTLSVGVCGLRPTFPPLQQRAERATVLAELHPCSSSLVDAIEHENGLANVAAAGVEGSDDVDAHIQVSPLLLASVRPRQREVDLKHPDFSLSASVSRPLFALTGSPDPRDSQDPEILRVRLRGGDEAVWSRVIPTPGSNSGLHAGLSLHCRSTGIAAKVDTTGTVLQHRLLSHAALERFLAPSINSALKPSHISSFPLPSEELDLALRQQLLGRVVEKHTLVRLGGSKFPSLSNLVALTYMRLGSDGSVVWASASNGAPAGLWAATDAALKPYLLERPSDLRKRLSTASLQLPFIEGGWLAAELRAHCARLVRASPLFRQGSSPISEGESTEKQSETDIVNVESITKDDEKSDDVSLSLRVSQEVDDSFVDLIASLVVEGLAERVSSWSVSQSPIGTRHCQLHLSPSVSSDADIHDGAKADAESVQQSQQDQVTLAQRNSVKTFLDGLGHHILLELSPCLRARTPEFLDPGLTPSQRPFLARQARSSQAPALDTEVGFSVLLDTPAPWEPAPTPAAGLSQRPCTVLRFVGSGKQALPCSLLQVEHKDGSVLACVQLSPGPQLPSHESPLAVPPARFSQLIVRCSGFAAVDIDLSMMGPMKKASNNSRISSMVGESDLAAATRGVLVPSNDWQYRVKSLGPLLLVGSVSPEEEQFALEAASISGLPPPPVHGWASSFLPGARTALALSFPSLESSGKDASTLCLDVDLQASRLRAMRLRAHHALTGLVIMGRRDGELFLRPGGLSPREHDAYLTVEGILGSGGGLLPASSPPSLSLLRKVGPSAAPADVDAWVHVFLDSQRLCLETWDSFGTRFRAGPEVASPSGRKTFFSFSIPGASSTPSASPVVVGGDTAEGRGGNEGLGWLAGAHFGSAPPHSAFYAFPLLIVLTPDGRAVITPSSSSSPAFSLPPHLNPDPNNSLKTETDHFFVVRRPRSTLVNFRDPLLDLTGSENSKDSTLLQYRSPLAVLASMGVQPTALVNLLAPAFSADVVALASTLKRSTSPRNGALEQAESVDEGLVDRRLRSHAAAELMFSLLRCLTDFSGENYQDKQAQMEVRPGISLLGAALVRLCTLSSSSDAIILPLRNIRSSKLANGSKVALPSRNLPSFEIHFSESVVLGESSNLLQLLAESARPLSAPQRPLLMPDGVSEAVRILRKAYLQSLSGLTDPEIGVPLDFSRLGNGLARLLGPAGGAHSPSSGGSRTPFSPSRPNSLPNSEPNSQANSLAPSRRGSLVETHASRAPRRRRTSISALLVQEEHQHQQGIDLTAELGLDSEGDGSPVLSRSEWLQLSRSADSGSPTRGQGPVLGPRALRLKQVLKEGRARVHEAQRNRLKNIKSLFARAAAEALRSERTKIAADAAWNTTIKQNQVASQLLVLSMRFNQSLKQALSRSTTGGLLDGVLHVSLAPNEWTNALALFSEHSGSGTPATHTSTISKYLQAPLSHHSHATQSTTPNTHQSSLLEGVSSDHGEFVPHKEQRRQQRDMQGHHSHFGSGTANSWRAPEYFTVQDGNEVKEIHVRTSGGLEVVFSRVDAFTVLEPLPGHLLLDSKQKEAEKEEGFIDESEPSTNPPRSGSQRHLSSHAQDSLNSESVVEGDHLSIASSVDVSEAHRRGSRRFISVTDDTDRKYRQENSFRVARARTEAQAAARARAKQLEEQRLQEAARRRAEILAASAPQPLSRNLTNGNKSRMAWAHSGPSVNTSGAGQGLRSASPTLQGSHAPNSREFVRERRPSVVSMILSPSEDYTEKSHYDAEEDAGMSPIQEERPAREGILLAEEEHLVPEAPYRPSFSERGAELQKHQRLLERAQSAAKDAEQREAPPQPLRPQRRRASVSEASSSTPSSTSAAPADRTEKPKISDSPRSVDSSVDKMIIPGTAGAELVEILEAELAQLPPSTRSRLSRVMNPSQTRERLEDLFLNRVIPAHVNDKDTVKGNEKAGFITADIMSPPGKQLEVAMMEDPPLQRALEVPSLTGTARAVQARSASRRAERDAELQKERIESERLAEEARIRRQQEELLDQQEVARLESLARAGDRRNSTALATFERTTNSINTPTAVAQGLTASSAGLSGSTGPSGGANSHDSENPISPVGSPKSNSTPNNTSNNNNNKGTASVIALRRKYPIPTPTPPVQLDPLPSSSAEILPFGVVSLPLAQTWPTALDSEGALKDGSASKVLVRTQQLVLSGSGVQAAFEARGAELVDAVRSRAQAVLLPARNSGRALLVEVGVQPHSATIVPGGVTVDVQLWVGLEGCGALPPVAALNADIELPVVIGDKAVKGRVKCGLLVKK